jgi:peptidoglycan/xylan/chitin deacetylase (PgdA/CDA1 family)
MINKNKSLLRAFVRAFALILVLSMMLVGCEEEPPKRTFPDYNNSNNSNNSSKDTIKPNNKPSNNNNSNSNSNNNNNTNNNSSSTGKKRVAITYDDGPHNVRTNAIVDELAKYGFNATFFVVGNRVDGKAYNGANAVKYAASKGNEIAIHAYTHNNYYDNCEKSVYNSELDKTYDAITDILPNAKVRLMRPVGGRITEERTADCDYAVIMWSVDSNDWKYKNDGQPGVNTIVNNVMSQVKDGSIILMHDIYENTYLATKEILKQLNAQGYEVVTVSELLGSPKAGVKYSKAS